MQQRAREHIYLFTTVFCLLMCAFLLVSVFLDIPIATVSHTREVHAPFMPAKIEVSATESLAPAQSELGVQITGELLTKQIASYLPKGFPVSGVSIEILGSGGFDLELAIKRSALRDFLEQGGVKLGLRQSIALGLLPDRLDVNAVLMCQSAQKTGANLELSELSVNGKDVNTDFLPNVIFDVLSSAINATLAANGLDWTNVVFQDGVMYFSS